MVANEHCGIEPCTLGDCARMEMIDLRSGWPEGRRPCRGLRDRASALVHGGRILGCPTTMAVNEDMSQHTEVHFWYPQAGSNC